MKIGEKGGTEDRERRVRETAQARASDEFYIPTLCPERQASAGHLHFGEVHDMIIIFESIVCASQYIIGGLVSLD